MNPSRRSFLYGSLSAGGILSFGGPAPRLLAAASETAPNQSGRKLVVIFLDGGNDGLNTIVPVRDPLYAKYRSATRLDPSRSLRLDDELSLHPTMRGLADVWESGRLAIIQGVGYPNHNRSHFVSQAVWHTGQLDAERNTSDGWLGRSLDQRQMDADSPLAYSVDFAETPPALRGRVTRTAVPPNVNRSEARRILELLSRHQQHRLDSKKREYVARTRQDAVSALDQLMASQAPQLGGFPDTELGQQLAQVAWLVRSGNAACVYYLRQSGYDTHAGQQPRHSSLLRELADALGAFDLAMDQNDLSSRVTVMVFSEFGRRVAENESGGTDHGAAGPVLLVGGGYTPGLHGQPYDLENLDNGDLPVTIDFRRVYAAVLQSSLNVDPASSLPQEFQPLPELRS